jgi:hypothetical protein
MVRGGGLWRDVAGSFACAAAGIILCALPHWIWLGRLGEPVWVADQDELYYLGVASQAYHEHLGWLGDPIRDGGPSLYQGLPLLPGIWIARLIGLGPTGIPLVWRFWGGGLAGLLWYGLVRLHHPSVRVAAAIALLLLTDIGMMEFRPLVRLGLVAWQLMSGHTGDLFTTKPLIFKQLRIASPCLTMPYLLLFLGLHARAHRTPSLLRQIVSGLGFGLLFYVYFYYWTAALLALALAAVLDAGHRRVSVNTTWIGALLGVPGLVSSYLLRRSTAEDWLLRSDKFLAIDRFSELIVPRPAVLLLLLGALVVWRHHRELILTWSLAASGLLLMNHQIVTGLQIENFHWSYVCGPSLSLLIGLLLARWFGRVRGPSLFRALVIASGLGLGTGIWLRTVEAVRTKEVVEILGIYRDYRDQRLRDPTARRLAPHAVVAGDELTVDWSAILERSRPLSNYWVMLSPSVDNSEWDLRIALNCYLLRRTRTMFIAEQEDTLLRPGFRGPWGRDRVQLQRRIRSRTAWFDKVAGQPTPYLARARLTAVFLPRSQAPPGDSALWKESQQGPYWSIWEYAPVTPGSP